MARWGGIEAGGTKFVCAVGSGPDDLNDEVRFPTTTPAETIGRAIAYFEALNEPLTAIGIGSFGPIDLRPGSPTWGFVTSTPKPGWQNADLCGTIGRALNLPIAFDTDVNAAALGELRWGAAQGLDAVLYITVGTGIGGGVIVHGKPVHGLMHPEIGHILVRRDPERDPFAGACPYHGDCMEGLAAGPALKARWGQPAETLADDHNAWPLEANYLAQGLVATILTYAPQRIILGGGVMQNPHLFPMIRSEVQRLLNGYLNVDAITSNIDEYIVPPALGNRAGILGSIALAQAQFGEA